MKTREKLPNANKWCHIYVDVDNITTFHNTETNETYRIIPDTESLGFYLEFFKDAKLQARNSFSFDHMKILAKLAGSNKLLKSLENKGGEQ